MGMAALDVVALSKKPAPSLDVVPRTDFGDAAAVGLSRSLDSDFGDLDDFDVGRRPTTGRMDRKLAGVGRPHPRTSGDGSGAIAARLLR